MQPSTIERLCAMSRELAAQGNTDDAETVLRFAMQNRNKCVHGQGMQSACFACNPPRDFGEPLHA